ncbi:response regulator [Stappia sp.]|uniref:response regulator n=1 Tax=Stappia sp. TaxID=1870903 RepID=UPI003A99A609
MTRHYAYGLHISDLDVVVVDDSKPMQAILRSTLLSFRVRRVRTFDTAEAALEAMRLDPPNFVITDWRMKPMSGVALLRTLRQRKMAPLCFLPVMFCTAHGTRTLIDRMLRDGAQHVLTKPLSPSALYDRLAWTLRDARPLVMGEDGRYVIDGVADTLDAKARKWQQIGNGRNVVTVKPAVTRRDVPHGTPARLEPAHPPLHEVAAAEKAGVKGGRAGFATVRAKRDKTAA